MISLSLLIQNSCIFVVISMNKIFFTLSKLVMLIILCVWRFLSFILIVDSSMNFSTIPLHSNTDSLGPIEKIAVDPKGCRLVCSHQHSTILSVFSIQNSTRFVSLFVLVLSESFIEVIWIIQLRIINQKKYYLFLGKKQEVWYV